jgi:hypothetical protein
MKPREYVAELLGGLRRCLAKGAGASEPMETLAHVAANIPTKALAAVDEVLRESFGEYQQDGWPKLGPADLVDFRRAPRGWSVLAVASFHRSGFVREAAVRGLAASGDGRAVRFLVVRLNDWVEQVQAAARATVDAFLRPEHAQDMIAALPLVEALARQRRADHRNVVSRVFAFIQSAECAPAVQAGCYASDRDTRRACFDLALTAGRRPAADVLKDALADREPAVRLWAARSVERAFPADWAKRLARRALKDRSIQVRRVALAALATGLSDEQAKPLFEAALLDTNTTARWQARAFMLARGPFDLAAFYRRALSLATQPAAIRGALFGLGESGTKDDLPMVLPYLSADRLGVRCAAVRARADLEPLSSTEPYLAALRLPDPGVSREARRALERRQSYFGATILHDLVLDQSLPPHTRRNALSLGRNRSKWERLPILLDACVDQDEMNANIGLVLVKGWCAAYNRSFLLPTRAQLTAAATSLARISRLLRAGPWLEIGTILSIFERDL